MELSRTVYLSLPAILLWIGLAQPSARADISYAYTGNDFTVCSAGPCPADYTSDYIIASISFADPLGDDLSNVNGLPTLTAWSIADELGYFSASSTAPVYNDLTILSISTNNTGDITGWFMGYNSFGPTGVPGITTNSSDTEDALFTCDGCGSGFEASANSSGVWTEVPEPSTSVLGMLDGAILFIWFASRFFRDLARRT